LNIRGQLNTYFRHFVAFVDEFELLDDKDLEPMHVIISSIRRHRR